MEFFTAQTASELNSVAVSYARDDDFVHFYDPENSEFFELIGKGVTDGSSFSGCSGFLSWFLVASSWPFSDLCFCIVLFLVPDCFD